MSYLWQNIVRKRQWSDGDQPSLSDPKANIHGKKILLLVRWDCRGTIHHEILKSNLTITVDAYVQQLQRVKEKLYEKRPALVNRKNIILLRDNARPHAARATQEEILELGWFHLTPWTFPQQTITFSVPCKTFWMEKPSIPKRKSVRLSKISSSPNQPHFTRKELISCQKDGRRS